MSLMTAPESLFVAEAGMDQVQLRLPADLERACCENGVAVVADGGITAVVSLATQGCLLIPALVVLPRLWGLDGIIAASPIAGAVTRLLAGAPPLHELALLRRLAGAPPRGLPSFRTQRAG